MSEEGSYNLSRDELIAIVERAAKKAAREAAVEAIRETMLTLGVDTSDPKAILDSQADRQYLRRVRVSSELLGSHVKKVGVGAVVIFLISAMGVGVATQWSKFVGPQ